MAGLFSVGIETLTREDIYFVPDYSFQTVWDRFQLHKHCFDSSNKYLIESNMAEVEFLLPKV